MGRDLGIGVRRRVGSSLWVSLEVDLHHVSNGGLGEANPGVNSIVSLAALGANIALNLVWIPRFGASGASLASTVSYTSLSVLLLVVYRRTTGVPWRDLLLLQREDALRLRTVTAAALRRRLRRTAR